jgi:hypothetical protein
MLLALGVVRRAVRLQCLMHGGMRNECCEREGRMIWESVRGRTRRKRGKRWIGRDCAVPLGCVHIE